MALTIFQGFVRFAGFALALLACGCAPHPPASPAPAAQAPISTPTPRIQLRNNATSLLHDLLDDEKNVSKVFVVKHGKQIEPLIKLIAVTAASDEEKLENLAKVDHELALHIMELPSGEKAVRDAIAKSKEFDLLFSAGPNFEFNLLLTQAEAQNYGWHLAKVAAENSSRPDEVKAFQRIAGDMKDLYRQTVEQMRALPAH